MNINIKIFSSYSILANDNEGAFSLRSRNFNILTFSIFNGDIYAHEIWLNPSIWEPPKSILL
jgi:hypothetical protein